MPTLIAIAIVRQGTEVVVGQRPADVPLAGYWEFPGGKVEAGELPAEAAARECREEAGLDVRVLGEYARVEHAYAHGTVELYFFECEAIDPGALQAPYRWVAITSLDQFRFPEANAGVVERLMKHVP